MKLHHKTPCKQCPWRKTSAQGYLGGHTAEHYADAVAEGEVTACHMRDRGPDSPDTAFCAGAASVMANACKVPFKQEGAAQAVKEVGRNADTFAHPAMFYEYHSGKKWVPRIMR